MLPHASCSALFPPAALSARNAPVCSQGIAGGCEGYAAPIGFFQMLQDMSNIAGIPVVPHATGIFTLYLHAVANVRIAR